jgi:diacylglycerol O-acyltransferase
VGRDFQTRLLHFDRFRQRVVQPGPLTAPLWEDVSDLDLGAHLVHVAPPPPSGETALKALVAGLASLPLDHRRPLWQAHV